MDSASLPPSKAVRVLPKFSTTVAYDTTTAVFDHAKRQNTVYGAVPFGQMANYGANGSPTVTLTKTLFAAGATTSTKTPSSSVSSQGTTKSSQVLFSASPRIGVVANGDGSDGNRTVTSTLLSTVFNTLTVTSTTTLSTSSSQTSTDSVVESTSSTKPGAAIATGTFPPDQTNSSHSGKVAGSVLGTLAVFGMIGFLVWYLLTKRNGKEKLKASVVLRRRKSSTPKTPQLEEQRMEETRAMMLQRSAELNKSKENVIGASLATSTDHAESLSSRSSGPETPRRLPAGRPSMIGVAMTSSTPPNTPPLPRSNSQKSNMTAKSMSSVMYDADAYPTSLMPGPYIPRASSTSHPLTSSRVIRKPAPIVTAYAPDSNSRSPLSPKAMFNAIGSTTNKAWRRASQALSPSAYQRLSPDSHSFFTPKRRDSHKPRNEELEIGAQTDSKKGWI